MLRRFYPIVLILVLYCVLILVGCSSNPSVLPSTADVPEIETAASTIKSTPSPQLFETTVEATNTASATTQLLPTPLSSPSSVTAETTATPTQVIPAFTATPLPTLTTAEAEILLRRLFQPEPLCPLPCWWDVTPGETMWAAVESFLRSFASEVYEVSGSNASHRSFEFYFYYPDRISPNISMWSAYEIVDGTVVDIELNLPPDDISAYWLLPQLLEEYGKPNEVWLSTFDNTPSGQRPFRMTLIYRDAGFVASYETWSVRKEADMLIGCPLDTPTATFLWLSSPGEVATFPEIHSEVIHLQDESQLYLDLKEATGLTIEFFHEQFRNGNVETCISTMAELWPY